MIKSYTEAELKARISKRYHDMIDWDMTMFQGFDGRIYLVDNGQVTKKLTPSQYETIKNANWYLRQIQQDPTSQW